MNRICDVDSTVEATALMGVLIRYLPRYLDVRCGKRGEMMYYVV